ncbi:hypothetical protein ZIOFF_054188 [Zingiber officinale]|uniref:Uncharacterized protein n=1 Tax=Zingiber officinale TaxID=94328 RepID=A0A8J5FEM8_ZINOF|nr:hypothetical protein ZIOFF_054188 [Zingiber officinale]
MEEFSFPIIVTDPWPHEGSRPPLFRSFPASAWFHSPEADPGHLLRSFSEGGANDAATAWKRTPRSPVLSDCGGDDDDESVLECEERMDMLWEDLNEELFQIDDGVEETGSRRRRRRSVGMEAFRLPAEGGEPISKKAHRLLLVPATMEEPSNRSSLRRRKKPGLVAMLRILKQLFIAQKIKPKQQK